MLYSGIHCFTVSCVEKVAEVYFLFSLKWELCLVDKDQKLNLFDIPYCRSMKLNFVYISRMDVWCDLPTDHSFCGFCAMELVITYIKWLLMYWILCAWFLGWESFFSWHYCVHTCCVAASCPFDVEGSLARDVVCVEPESGYSPFSSAVVGLSCALTVLSPTFLCHGWSQASALSCMKQMLDKAMLTLW